MKNKIAIAIVIAISAVLSGCASNPVSAKIGANYYDAGMVAERNGELSLARQNYSRAYANAQLGNLGPAPEAYAMYEWARVTGYLGMFADAEKGFNEVLALIDKAGQDAEDLRPPTLLELARLLHDTGKHGKAAAVYKKALVELEKFNIQEEDPIGFTIVLDDYAKSLMSIGDDLNADDIAARLESIKNKNKGVEAKFIGRRYKTP